MWCSIVLAAVMVAAAGGQRRFSYDGTPLADNVVLSGQGQQPQQQSQPQPVFVEQPQQVFVLPQPQPVFTVPAPQPVQPPQQVFVPPQPQPPQPVFTVPAPQPVQPPVFQVVPAAPAEQFLPQPPSACPSTLSLVHTTYQGRFYHFSWCRHPGQVYSHSAARQYCRGLATFEVGNIRTNFDLIRVTGSTDFNFFLRVLLLHQIPSFWTRDLSSTALYEVRELITKFGDCVPGQDCLSLEASPDGLFLLENMCSLQKAVICVAEH